MNLGRYITRSALYYPNNIALIYGDKRFTYKEFEHRTNRLAQGLLSLGLKKGDRIAIQSWNRSEIVETEVACYKTGMVRIPINARLSLSETLYVLNDSGANAIVIGPQHMGPLLENEAKLKTVEHFICMENAPKGKISYYTLLEQGKKESPEIDLEPDKLAVLSYSSGTTGKLKAIMQSLENRLAMIRKALMIPDTSIGPDDIFAHAGPITHASGMMLMPVMFRGGCNLILCRFDVELLLKAIQKEKVTYTLLVPTMINMILDYPEAHEYDLGSLRGVLYGAAPISKARAKQAIELFGPTLIQGYGMTETTSLTTILTPKDHMNALRVKDQERLASCGRPYFDTEVKVVNENGEEVPPGQIGEIIMRGPDLMQGYYKDQELTNETIRDGWIYTSDMAKVDEEGYIYIMDRKSDTIISGGFNVYPSEVEQVLYGHPSVFEVCVVGVPDDKWGEAVKAVVVLKERHKATEQELMDYCMRSLASYKKPRSVDFVDELPKNPNGKILRRVVKEKYWRDKDRKVI
ncbi:MAG: long-chain fatty acid--CoA ligase [Desulfobacteraceae bacterium]|nr:long-chain fatty acid--CoA ligase [Desulfobacteraceae bacterium]